MNSTRQVYIPEIMLMLSYANTNTQLWTSGK
jgi:hypothetical protein